MAASDNYESSKKIWRRICKDVDTLREKGVMAAAISNISQTTLDCHGDAAIRRGVISNDRFITPTILVLLSLKLLKVSYWKEF